MGWLLGVFWWCQAQVGAALGLPAALGVWLYSRWWKDRSQANRPK